MGGNRIWNGREFGMGGNLETGGKIYFEENFVSVVN